MHGLRREEGEGDLVDGGGRGDGASHAVRAACAMGGAAAQADGGRARRRRATGGAQGLRAVEGDTEIAMRRITGGAVLRS